MIWDHINPIDVEQLKVAVKSAQPFPFFSIDNFLNVAFAEQVHACFPSSNEIEAVGKSFNAVNERGKTQVTDVRHFPPAIRKLNSILAAPEWLELLSNIMSIPKLLPDDALAGGGIHQTGPRGHLDVHVDFNYLEQKNLHRRLNILIYFNKDWREEWGGNIELWDKTVKQCHHSFSPIFNRCVVFATSDISYHGVTRVETPIGVTRNSFAAYYYTREAPPEWAGEARSTVFKARPNEQIKGRILMPLEYLKRNWRSLLRNCIGRN
ncbi:MAG: hypothetical protein Aurels2KO_38210 [Aureliella sp.]